MHRRAVQRMRVTQNDGSLEGARRIAETAQRLDLDPVVGGERDLFFASNAYFRRELGRWAGGASQVRRQTGGMQRSEGKPSMCEVMIRCRTRFSS